jgi:hypothetical protein
MKTAGLKFRENPARIPLSVTSAQPVARTLKPRSWPAVLARSEERELKKEEEL